MSGLKDVLKHWLADTRDPIWLLGILLVTFAATHRPPESAAALVKIDDRNFFECADSGCWWMVRSDTTWVDLARQIKADPSKLQADNPQVSREVVEAGQLIRLRSSSEAAH
jgi:hypothetical protein